MYIFKVLIATYSWLMLVILTVVFGLLVYLGRLFTWILGVRPNHIIHRISCTWAKSFFASNPLWTVKIEGKENLPKKGEKIVIVANHQSNFDIFSIYLLGIQFRWLSKASVFNIPIVGDAMRWSGYIGVKRKDPASRKEALNAAEKTVMSDAPMLFFPEGTRSRDGEVKNFKIGAFKLAKDTGAKILPIAVVGTREFLPPGSFVPNGNPIVLKVLPRVDSAEAEDLEEFASTVRQKIIDALQ